MNLNAFWARTKAVDVTHRAIMHAACQSITDTLLQFAPYKMAHAVARDALQAIHRSVFGGKPAPLKCADHVEARAEPVVRGEMPVISRVTVATVLADTFGTRHKMRTLLCIKFEFRSGAGSPALKRVGCPGSRRS